VRADVRGHDDRLVDLGVGGRDHGDERLAGRRVAHQHRPVTDAIAPAADVVASAARARLDARVGAAVGGLRHGRPPRCRLERQYPTSRS
jgi:hypothetical protein